MEFLEFKLQHKLRTINDELHQAMKDHQILIERLDKNSNDVLAKEKVSQLQMRIHILGQNQKAIFFDIRKKGKDAFKTSVKRSLSDTAAPDILQVTLVDDDTKIQPNEVKADYPFPSAKMKEADVNQAIKQARARRARALKAHAIKTKKNWKLLHQEIRNAAVPNAFIKENRAKTDQQKPLKLIEADPVDSKVLEPAEDKGTTPAVDNSAEMFLLALELIPTNTLHLRKLQEPKRATRQKRSTANHSQFVYTDSWENKKKKKKLASYVKVSLPEIETQKTGDTVGKVGLSAKITYPILSPKQQAELAKKQLLELQKKPFYYHPAKESHAILDGYLKQEVRSCNVLSPSVLASDSHCTKTIVPRNKANNVLHVLHNGDAPYSIKVVDTKQRRHSIETSDKAIPQKRPMPSLLKAMHYPAKVEKYGNKTDGPILVPVPNSDLSLKIPGLPSSLTIMRVLDRQAMCCMCRKTGTVITNGYHSTKDLVDQVSSALTSCNNCNETYHMTCNPSAAISDSYHFCPHCSIKQLTNVKESNRPVDKNAYSETKLF